MPTNQQRREAAKRKLERQLERRAQKARRRKQLTIAGSVVGVVALLTVGGFVYIVTNGDDSAEPTTTATEGACTYDESGTSAREVTPPPADGAASLSGPVSVDVATNRGPIGLTLDSDKAPCTVNSFLSLADQKFFDNTTCHRITAQESLKVLQCGDPTGTGMGGPGYLFANEYPTPRNEGEFVPENIYTRGTLAMANSGPDTNGSQFFLVYGDTKLPPDYTIFGTIDEAGLATLDKIAGAGITPSERGPEDGTPAQPVEILSVTPA